MPSRSKAEGEAGLKEPTEAGSRFPEELKLAVKRVLGSSRGRAEVATATARGANVAPEDRSMPKESKPGGEPGPREPARPVRTSANSDEPPRTGEAGGAFPEKLDRAVGRVLPGRWLATALVGVGAVALVLFVLMIVAFAIGPNEALIAERDSALAERDSAWKASGEAARRLSDEQGKHAGTTTALQEAQHGLEVGAAHLGGARNELARAKTEVERLTASFEDLRTEYSELRELNEQTRGAVSSVDGKVSSLDGKVSSLIEANGVRHKLEAELGGLEAELGKLKAQYAELDARKTEQEKLDARARAAFVAVHKATASPGDGRERLAAYERLRSSLGRDIAGTAYQARLDVMIENERIHVRKAEQAERERRLRAAKHVYAGAVSKAAAIKDDPKALEILRAAADEAAGTYYEARLLRALERRENAGRERIDRAIYDEAVSTVKKAPNAYEENLKVFEEALGKVRGTRYAGKLQGVIDARRRTFRTDVARHAYESVTARIRRNSHSLDENIKMVEEALPKTEKTEFEAPLKKWLAETKWRRTELAGREAYDQALSQLRKSPNDYETNIVALEKLKVKAEGSSWANWIEQLINQQGAYLSRTMER